MKSLLTLFALVAILLTGATSALAQRIAIPQHNETWQESVDEYNRADTSVSLTYTYDWYVPSPLIGWGGQSFVEVWIDFECEDIIAYPFLRQIVHDTVSFRWYPQLHLWSSPYFTGTITASHTFSLNKVLKVSMSRILRKVNITADYYAKLYRTTAPGSTQTGIWMNDDKSGYLVLDFMPVTD